MIKKYLSFLLIISTITSALYARDCGPCTSCDCEVSSRSYLSVRPLFQSASPEMTSAFRYDRPHVKDDGCESAVQFVLFGSQSNQEKDLARYFFPFCKTELTVDEAVPAPNPQDQNQFGPDLLAGHFNIFTLSVWWNT